MALTFRITIDEAESWNVFDAWIKANQFPRSFELTEFDLLSFIRMSRYRNKSLHKKLVEWYGSIDQKFRVI